MFRDEIKRKASERFVFESEHCTGALSGENKKMGVVIAEYMPNPNQISPPPLSLLSVEMGLHSGHSRGTTIPRYVNI